MTTPLLRAMLLGSPSLENLDPDIAGLGPGKPLAMLAYLLVEGESQRDQLINLLWGDQTDKNARNAFRQTLHRLRAALGESLLKTSPSGISIDSSGLIWTDLGAFEELLQRNEIEAAIRMYRGPFLDGIGLDDGEFGHWLLGRRRKLEARFLGALRSASSECLQAGDPEKAMAYARQLTQTAPLDANAALVFFNAFITAGRIDEGRSSLEEFARRYREELDEDIPLPVKEALARIRKHQHAPAEPQNVGRSIPPIAGREAELARLGASWTVVRDGMGAAVLIEGSEGIGKSALIAEFLRRAESLGPMLVLSGHERSAGSRIPYASIAAALRGTLTAPGLSGASRHLLAEASRLLPELRDQFDLPQPDRITDDGARVRLFEGIAALLDAVAYEQPVCVVLEDFHNAARETTDLLQYLAGRLGSVAVMFIVSIRNNISEGGEGGVLARGHGHPKHDGWMSHGFSSINLGPVGRDAAARIISDVSDHEVVSADECARLAELSGGIPYRALELARQFAGGMNPKAIPATLPEALWARLKGFSPTQQRLFIACALIERAVSIRTAAAAAHISDSAALDAALALEGAGLLVQTPEGIKPAHDFSATIALESTGPAGRALLAGWAAEALEHSPGTRNAELAYLYNIAGNRQSGFRASIAAAYDAGVAGSSDLVLGFLQMARASATTPEEHRTLEAAEAVFLVTTRRISGKTVEVPSGGGEAPPEEAEVSTRDGQGATNHTGTASTTPVMMPQSARQYFNRPRVRFVVAASVVFLAAFVLAQREKRFALKGPVLPDTLFLAGRTPTGGTQHFFVTGQIVLGKSALRNAPAPSNSWMDSVSLPWINPKLSPAGTFVAIERIGAAGTDIFLSSADRLNPRRLSREDGDNIITGWAPDGSHLLSLRGRQRQDGSYASDLLAYAIPSGPVTAIDTAADRSVVEASWSPDGTHMAWTARTGKTHQQDVFIASADGTDLQNVSAHPGEDYHISWAPDGGRIAFTSEREGNAEIFAYEISTRKLWRLTWDAAQDDRSVFSPDGNFVAFESTRGGTPSVYVTRSWGGTPVKLSSGIAGMGIIGWGRPRAPAYLASLRIAATEWLDVGNSVAIRAEGFDQSGRNIPITAIRWMVLDPEILQYREMPMTGGASGVLSTGELTGLRAGIGRLVASAAGWRSDTAIVQVGKERAVLFRDDFEAGIKSERWIALGVPNPRPAPGKGVIGSAGFLPNGDRQWESGLLSRRSVPLRAGLDAEVWVRAPLTSATAPISFKFALVASEQLASLDTVAPRFLTLASIEWLGHAGRISYGAEREVWTEPVGSLATAPSHRIRISLDAFGRVEFYVDGSLRRRSNLRVRTAKTSAQLWLGGGGTGDQVVFDNVVITSSPTALMQRGQPDSKESGNSGRLR